MTSYTDHRARRAPSALGALLAICAILSACSVRPEPTFDGPRFPEDKPRLRTLNVQVEVGDTEVELANGSAVSLPAGSLWLNRWFAADIDGLASGERLVVPLERFRDENGLPPRAGGFFATRERDHVVLAEIETDRGLHGLRVLAGDR